MKLDFNEANILIQNLFKQDDTKESLIFRLQALLSTTNDAILKNSVLSLIDKIESLTPDQLRNIQKIVNNNQLITTSNSDY